LFGTSMSAESPTELQGGPVLLTQLFWAIF